jgi:hypothetical protein
VQVLHHASRDIQRSPGQRSSGTSKGPYRLRALPGSAAVTRHTGLRPVSLVQMAYCLALMTRALQNQPTAENSLSAWFRIFIACSAPATPPHRHQPCGETGLSWFEMAFLPLVLGCAGVINYYAALVGYRQPTANGRLITIRLPLHDAASALAVSRRCADSRAARRALLHTPASAWDPSRGSRANTAVAVRGNQSDASRSQSSADSGGITPARVFPYKPSAEAARARSLWGRGQRIGSAVQFVATRPTRSLPESRERPLTAAGASQGASPGLRPPTPGTTTNRPQFTLG